MSKQNKLNIFLQGKSKCIYDVWSQIQAFRKKLEFLKNTLAKFKLPEAEEHFPQLTKAQKEHKRPIESFEEFISVLDSLIQNYNKRFKDFEKHENCLKLTCSDRRIFTLVYIFVRLFIFFFLNRKRESLAL